MGRPTSLLLGLPWHSRSWVRDSGEESRAKGVASHQDALVDIRAERGVKHEKLQGAGEAFMITGSDDSTDTFLAKLYCDTAPEVQYRSWAVPQRNWLGQKAVDRDDFVLVP
ncbi:hypothetical protein HYDPIDRAFT_110309 [Hydnomerulius pinastri MD-312]|nr:hypothetical protein HYDPIDRAFT_110309 [Hydnomerulius pinastri MD-312]